MSALARLLRARRWRITGSDSDPGEIGAELKAEGITVKKGHRAANLPPLCDLVVTSQAIAPRNPELIAARKRRCLIRTYPEMLGELSEGFDSVAVAGTHGKSTVSAMLAAMFLRGGQDPTVLIGAKVPFLKNRNYRSGRSRRMVFEADEYGRAFHAYSPAAAVITNIEFDHPETYPDLASVRRAFLDFARRIRHDGTLVLNANDPVSVSLRKDFSALAKRRGLTLHWVALANSGFAKIQLRVPGRHNREDSVLAAAMAKACGVAAKDIIAALRVFPGIWRRLEPLGTRAGALIFDDYAHHPTEVRAGLSALRERYPRRKILCVFEPHQNRRFRALFDDFKTAFREADETLILPVYRPRGRDISASPRRSAAALVRHLQAEQPPAKVFYLADYRHLAKAVAALGPLRNKVIVFMGAGNVSLLARQFARAAPRKT